MSEFSDDLIQSARDLGAVAHAWNASRNFNTVVCRNKKVERKSQECSHFAAVTTWRDGRQGTAVQSPASDAQKLLEQALIVGENLGDDKPLAYNLELQPLQGTENSNVSVQSKNRTDTFVKALIHIYECIALDGLDLELIGTEERHHIEFHASTADAMSYQASTFTIQARVTVRGERVGFLNHTVHASSLDKVLVQLRDDLEDLTETATVLAKSPVHQLPTGPVLIDGRVVAALLDIITPAFQLDSVLEGRSPLEGDAGSRIAASGLSLIDDCSVSWSPYNGPWDDEGTPTKRTTIIENGVLKEFLNTKRTAAIENSECTGNGWRSSPDSMPTVQPSCLTLQHQEQLDPRNSDRTVLRIVQANGAHISNGITGDFSIGANAVVVHPDGRTENGGAVSVAGNIFDMLKRVFGHDGIIRSTGGNRSFIVSPGIWVEGLVIGR